MSYDVTIIGSGPGGYVAAIRCAQLGMKTAIIERYKTLGGTCLNVGCIPSKALLDSSEHYHNLMHTFETHGIKAGSAKVDMPQMIKRKNEVVSQTCDGVSFLMNKNKIDVHHGHGSFASANEITVTKDDGTTETINTKKVIIATGSKPITPEAFKYDKKMVIVGAGVIGLELGSVFGRLGTEIEVVEFQNAILPGMDKDVVRELKKTLKKMGMKFHLGHKVTDVNATAKSAKVTVQKRDSDESFDLTADYCLIAIGRRPYTDNLGLENVGIERDDRGRILVDEHLESSVPGIFAIGDVIKGAMLAHKAEEEGIFVAEYMSGQKPHIDYNLIPGVVYTWPEVSAVGQTEEQLKEAGIPYKSGKFPFKALGRARASMDIAGVVKVLAHKDTDEILGVHMCGARAADMIMEAVALMEFKASAEDMARISHPHPTYTEATKEAALAATENRPLHI